MSQSDEPKGLVIQNRIIMITGLPWTGKSFLAAFFASFYREIYSNLEIKLKWAVVSNPIWDLSSIQKIGFSRVKGCIIIEEAWVNISSRSFMSEANMEFSALWMLWRKKNKDIFVIAQLGRTIDVNIRELCQFRFDMRSWRVGSSIMFEMTIYDRFGNILGSKDIDLVEWARYTWYSYSTLEDSIIDKTPKKKVFNTPPTDSWFLKNLTI